MPQIKDFSASQLARAAENVQWFRGRRDVTMGRLVYHALVLDPHQGTALRCLSDFIAYRGVMDLSAVVLEYALSPGVPLSDFDRRLIDEIRFRNLWMAGFSRRADGQTSLEAGGSWDRSQFQVDEPGYRAFLEPVVRLGGSLEGAFRAAHTLAGAMSGLLVHHEGKTRVEEVFRPDRFLRAAAYDRWLWEDTAPLVALERVRQDTTGPGKKGKVPRGVRPAPSPHARVTQHSVDKVRCPQCGVLNERTYRHCAGCGLFL